jgi:hypothetical protein
LEQIIHHFIEEKCMKMPSGMLCAITIAVAVVASEPTQAKEKDLEMVDVEFQGDEGAIEVVEGKARADPKLLRGDDPPCMEVPKEKGKDPSNRATYLCKPLIEPLTTLAAIYQVAITSEGYEELQPLTMTMSTTTVPDCSRKACEAKDNAKCKAYRRSVYYPYRCYDERFLGSSQHECF